MQIVKVKQNGSGQDVRIPKDLSFEGATELTAYRVGEKLILGPARVRKSFRTLNDDCKPVDLSDDSN
ncbi:MAG: hypothetical protein MPK06_05405 [Alphaproteobacteria bacterium]|nr:hypothetical protein [Alphaproteobacteria bacterium]MDA8003945.1 hypothetical protein [Alphaproteobacteria bacterium]MDA8005958.1 hypothetical protein [Alphaproteobacteria bacterium]MDA8013238.1 hypothetical protein [Alphaproteobacteria bacterium]